MSNWQAFRTHVPQTPDSLAVTEPASEQDTPMQPVATTAHETVPVEHAPAVATAPARQHPHPTAAADTIAAPRPQEPLPLTIQDTAPADSQQTEAPDSLTTALLHFGGCDGIFFQDSPYWHPELPARQTGYPCHLLPYRVSHDSHIACAMLMCLVMLVYMLLRYGGEMRSQMHDFFLPARAKQGHRQGLSTAQGLLSMPFVCLMLSVMGSIAVSVAEQDSLSLLPDSVTRLAVQGFYMASWLLLLFAKVNSYAFTNWIFFNKQARREWHDNLFLIQALETVLLYPILLLVVYVSASPQVFVWSTLSVIALTKALLLYKAGRVFSVKIYGVLHLFVYFCTLEVAPMWVTLKILTRITDLL